MGTLGPVLRYTAIVTLVVTNISVLLRFYTRIFIQKKFAADDWLVAISELNFIGFMICVLNEIANGIGNHLIEILIEDPHRLIIGLKWWYIAQTFYLVSTCTIKMVIVLFFYSLKPPRTLRVAAVCIAVFSVLAGICTEYFYLFQCAPVSYFWTRVMPGVLNVLDILTDVGLASLPCIMVWNMRMTRAKKFGVSILLGVGALPAISAIARAFYIKDLTLDVSDFTYSAWAVTMMSALEPAIAITVVCLIQVRPLMRKLLPERWFSSRSENQPHSPDHPPTFGAADKRPKRRTIGMSLLEDTLGSLATRLGNNRIDDEILETRGNKENRSGSEGESEILDNIEKGEPVYIRHERI